MPSVPEIIRSGFERQKARLGNTRRTGWKIGLNSPDVQKKLGLSGPVIGLLTEETKSHNFLETSGPPGHLVLEAEIAIRLGIASDGKFCAAAIAPAFELLCVTGPVDNLEDLVAQNTYHRSFCIGDWLDDTDALIAAEVSVACDERPASPALAPLIVGSPIEIVDLCRRRAEELGETLQNGDIILGGSLNGPLLVRPGMAAHWMQNGRTELSVVIR